MLDGKNPARCWCDQLVDPHGDGDDDHGKRQGACDVGEPVGTDDETVQRDQHDGEDN